MRISELTVLLSIYGKDQKCPQCGGKSEFFIYSDHMTRTDFAESKCGVCGPVSLNLQKARDIAYGPNHGLKSAGSLP